MYELTCPACIASSINNLLFIIVFETHLLYFQMYQQLPNVLKKISEFDENLL